jgi:uncharacterized protein YutD
VFKDQQKLNQLQNYRNRFDELQKHEEFGHICVRTEYIVKILYDVGKLTNDNEENFHPSTAVLQENPEN